MTLSKADKKRAADIRSEVAAVKKLQKIPPILPHLATALQKPASTWGARPAEKQQLQSKLMALPAELRNQIVRLTDIPSLRRANTPRKYCADPLSSMSTPLLLLQR